MAVVISNWFVDWPMPIIWLLLAGLLCRRFSFGRALVTFSSIGLIVFSLPGVGNSLFVPLSSGSQTEFSKLTRQDASAILVPTAGTFRDPNGKWWPEENSIRRFIVAVRLARKLGLPVIVAGGPTRKDQPAEAETVVEHLQPQDVDIIVVRQGRNSAEAAVEVAKLPLARQSSLILVTSPQHIARMRAALRRQGLVVRASVAARPYSATKHVPISGILDAVPSIDGFDATRRAFYEYVGIVWYLVSNKIRFQDL